MHGLCLPKKKTVNLITLQKLNSLRLDEETTK